MKRFAIAVAALAALSAPAAHAALQPGAKAPDFQAPAFMAGKAFDYKLKTALKKGPVVLYFFPAAYTKGCNLEAHLFSEAADDFKKQGATVIGVTAGNTDRLAEFSKDTETCGGKFPVASDADLKIAKSYDAAMAERPMSNRTSYVIAPNGTILHTYSAMAANDHVTETMNALKAWKAGKKG